MEDVIRWKNDIGMVYDNHVGCQYFLPEMLNRSTSAQELSVLLREFYEESIDRTLADTPEDSVGHWLVRELCTNLPHQVFDLLAEDYWRDR